MSSELYKCDNCIRTFETQGKLNRHRHVHSKPNRCNQCDRGFALRADLTRHIKSRHRLGSDKHSCPIESCPFITVRKDNLNQHIEKTHGGKHHVAEFDAMAEGAVEGQLVGDSTSQYSSYPNSTALAIDGGSQRYSGLYEALATGNIYIVQGFLDKGLDINHVVHESASLLHCAARAGQLSMVQYLIANGASINVFNSSGQKLEPPVYDAIRSGDLDTVACLHHAEHTKEDSFRLPRILARCGSTQILKLCLAHVNEVVDPYFNYRLLDAAARTGQVSIVRAILESHDCMSVHDGDDLSTAKTDISVLSNKLQVPWTSNMEKFNFFTPLHHAAAKGHVEIVRLLSSHSLHCPPVGRGGLTPLHFAARAGHVSVVEYFLDQEGTDINCSDTDGHTPLYNAARAGMSGTVRVLLRHPETNATRSSELGTTPLHVSALYGHWHIAQILLNHERTCSDKQKPTMPEAPDQLVPCDIMKRIFDTCDFHDINLRRGAYQNKEGLLHLAIRMGDCDLLQMLSDHKDIDINRDNYDAGSPLRLAVQLNELEAAKILLRHKDINIGHQRWDQNLTPLQIARRDGHTSMVDLLLAHRARDDTTVAENANLYEQNRIEVDALMKTFNII